MSQLNTLLQQLDQMRSLLLSYPKETVRELYKKVLQSGFPSYYEDANQRILSLALQEKISITEQLIKQFHHTLFSDSSDEYRSIDLPPTNGYHHPPKEELDHIMRHLADQFRSSVSTLHPIELASMMHKRVLDIQPFTKGNEEIAFLLMNTILLSYGYTPFVQTKETKSPYEKAIVIARTEYDMEPLSLVIAHGVLSSMKQVLDSLSH